jgi:WD repeat-containing protein 42A
MNWHMGSDRQISAAVRPCLPLLNARQLSHDPLLTQPWFQQQWYGLPSFVKRLCLEKKLEAHEGCVNCINFSPSGQLLVSGSDDLHVVIWDWVRGRMLANLDSGHISNIFQAKFMPYTAESVLVTAARDGQVRCLVLSSSGSLVASKRVALHQDSAHKIALEPYSPHVFLSCGEDGSVLEVDLREEAKRNKILVVKNEKGRRVALYSIFIDPSNTHLFAVSGRDQFARIYDRRKLKQDQASDFVPVNKLCPQHLASPESDRKRANVTCLVYSYDGNELLCSYNDEDIYLFNTRDE